VSAAREWEAGGGGRQVLPPAGCVARPRKGGGGADGRSGPPERASPPRRGRARPRGRAISTGPAGRDPLLVSRTGVAACRPKADLAALRDLVRAPQRAAVPRL